MVVGCAKEKFWTRLCDVIGKPEWNDDPRVRELRRRARENREVLIPLLEEIFVTRSVDEWLPELYAAVDPVRTDQHDVAGPGRGAHQRPAA